MSLRPVLRLHDCCRVRKELSLRMDDDSKTNWTSSKHGFSILLQWRYYIYKSPRRRCSVSVFSYMAPQVCSSTGYYSVFISYPELAVRFRNGPHSAVARLYSPQGFVRPLNGVFFIVPAGRLGVGLSSFRFSRCKLPRRNHRIQAMSPLLLRGGGFFELIIHYII